MHIENQKTWIMWSIFTLSIAAYVLSSSNMHSVTYWYKAAAWHWIHSEPLYTSNAANHDTVAGRGFLYFPQSAIFYIPFAVLPTKVGDIVWRSLSIGLFALGIKQLSTLAKGLSAKDGFPIMTLICLPIMISSARNGQMNTIISALMVLGMVAIYHRRWWKAALLISLSVAIKPICLVLLLLAFALYKPLRLNILITLLIISSLPFLCQHSRYVLAQYHDCWLMLQQACQAGESNSRYAQFFAMITQFTGLHATPLAENMLRLLLAMGTLGLCYISQKKYSPSQAIVMILSFASIYLMLFNPRTENNSYVILAPVLAYYTTQYVQIEKNRLKAIILIMCDLGIIAAYNIAKVITPHHVSWVAPLMTTIFAGVMIQSLYQIQEDDFAEDEFDELDGVDTIPTPTKISEYSISN